METSETTIRNLYCLFSYNHDFHATINIIEQAVKIGYLLDTLLYAESISAWSNQVSVMCLLSILNQ